MTRRAQKRMGPMAQKQLAQKRLGPMAQKRLGRHHWLELERMGRLEPLVQRGQHGELAHLRSLGRSPSGQRRDARTGSSSVRCVKP